MDIRGAHESSIDYATWMAPIWQRTDYIACKCAAGTGDVHPLDSITFPCIKCAATTITRADTPVATLVSEALAHNCQFVLLNYEDAVSASTMLGYYEADQPVIIAAGLRCILVPGRPLLNTIMNNSGYYNRYLPLTEKIFIQSQTWQTNPNDGTFATNMAALVTIIRAATATMPVIFQMSTEKPTSAIPASEIISQAKAVRGLNLRNGGFGMWYDPSRWTNAQTVMETIRADIRTFSNV